MLGFRRRLDACLLRGLAPHHAIPPGADAGCELVIALDHVDRLAQASRRGLDADRARLGALLRRHPQPVVAPHARAPGDLFRPPPLDVDDSSAPAVLHHESRRRIRIERGDLVVDVPAQRDADAAFLAQRQIVALPDVVEAEELHHQMMGGAAAGLDEGDRVVARIGVEEVGVERSHHIVGQAEPEHVAIERHGVVDVLDVQHGMTHAERSGAEARDRAAGLERLARGLGAVDDFEPIAERIGEHDEVLDAPFIRQRARAAGNLDPGLLKSRGKIIERGGVGHLPTEESHAFAAVFADDHALLAVVHPQRQALAAALDELHPEELGAEALPVLERFCTNADIAETLNIHGAASVRAQSCAGIWASLTILANFARSALNRCSNASGVLATAPLPVMRRRSSTSGAASAALARCWMAATSSRSATVGTSGSAAERLAPATASARTVPAATCGSVAAIGVIATWISPVMRAGKMAASPLYGTGWMSTPAAVLNISMVRWSGLPAPVMP